MIDLSYVCSTNNGSKSVNEREKEVTAPTPNTEGSLSVFTFVRLCCLCMFICLGMLRSLFPEYNWFPWLFPSLSMLFWEKIENQRAYVEWWEREAELRKGQFASLYRDGDSNAEINANEGGKTGEGREESVREWWSGVTVQGLLNAGMSNGLLSCYNFSVESMFATIFPEHKIHIPDTGMLLSLCTGFLLLLSWSLFISSSDVKPKRSVGEGQLLASLKLILPLNTVCIPNYQHPDLLNSHTGFSSELDIFIPALNLAFEYQGQQHYRRGYFQGNSAFKMQQERDKQKQEMCMACDITLVVVPYWWEGDAASLAATIEECRPDIRLRLNN